MLIACIEEQLKVIFAELQAALSCDVLHHKESPDSTEQRIPLTAGLRFSANEKVPQKITADLLATTKVKVKTWGKSPRWLNGNINFG